MALTILTPQVCPGGVTPAGAELTWTTADTTNGNGFKHRRDAILLIRNPDTSSHNVTLDSQPSVLGREDDDVLAIDQDEVWVCGPFPADGWKDGDGNVGFTSASALIEYAVVIVPRG
jgi:hypothetical protein